MEINTPKETKGRTERGSGPRGNKRGTSKFFHSVDINGHVIYAFQRLCSCEKKAPALKEFP